MPIGHRIKHQSFWQQTNKNQLTSGWPHQSSTILFDPQQARTSTDKTQSILYLFITDFNRTKNPNRLLINWYSISNTGQNRFLLPQSNNNYSTKNPNRPLINWYSIPSTGQNRFLLLQPNNNYSTVHTWICLLTNHQSFNARPNIDHLVNRFVSTKL